MNPYAYRDETLFVMPLDENTSLFICATVRGSGTVSHITRACVFRTYREVLLWS